MQIFLTIVELILAVALIGVVILQSGKSAGLSGAVGGGSETFLSKNKSKSMDAQLARITKWVAGAFVIVTILLNIV